MLDEAACCLTFHKPLSKYVLPGHKGSLKILHDVLQFHPEDPIKTILTNAVKCWNPANIVKQLVELEMLNTVETFPELFNICYSTSRLFNSVYSVCSRTVFKCVLTFEKNQLTIKDQSKVCKNPVRKMRLKDVSEHIDEAKVNNYKWFVKMMRRDMKKEIDSLNVDSTPENPIQRIVLKWKASATIHSQQPPQTVLFQNTFSRNIDYEEV